MLNVPDTNTARDLSFSRRKRTVLCKLVFLNNYLQCWGSDPHVFGLPGSVSICQRYGSEFGSFHFLKGKVLSGLKQAGKIKF
jgi:hypothetical protein